MQKSGCRDSDRQSKSNPIHLRAQAFGGFAGGATAGKRVQDQVACFGQELYEELGELNREAGRVGLDFLLRTAREVVAVGVVVPQCKEVQGNEVALLVKPAPLAPSQYARVLRATPVQQVARWSA